MCKFNDLFPTSYFSALFEKKFSIGIAVLMIVMCYILRNIQKIPKKRIPGPKLNGLIAVASSAISIFKNKTANKRVLFLQEICAWCHVFRKEGMLYFWGGRKQLLMLFKAETVEPILKSNENLNKYFAEEFLAPVFKEGLLSSTKEKWKHRRKLITPLFHFRIIDGFIHVFNEQAKILSTKLAEAMQSNECIDVIPFTARCTFDIICETAMGKKINAQGNSVSSYIEATAKICRAVSDRLIRPWLWRDFIYYKTKEGKLFLSYVKTLETFSKKIIAERKEELSNGRENDMFLTEESAGEDLGQRHKRSLPVLDLLIDFHLKDNSFTLEDVAEEVDTFLLAGYDTTSNSLSWAFYMLGLHPDIQAKVHEELDVVLGDDLDKNISAEDIKELKYLDCVLKETRRLFPPIPFIARYLEEDIDINGYTIPKDTSCGILIYMLHRDPDVFPNPEKFDPDRFLSHNVSKRHPHSYIPFSAGPRNCIGQRYAITETITVMATVLRRFEIKSLDPLDKVQVAIEIVLQPQNGLRVVFKPRRKSK